MFINPGLIYHRMPDIFSMDCSSLIAIKIHLDNILKERNMTSKELCKKVHITEANLSILRSGKAKGVRFSTINKICYYLECDVGDILKFDGRLEEEDE